MVKTLRYKLIALLYCGLVIHGDNTNKIPTESHEALTIDKQLHLITPKGLAIAGSAVLLVGGVIKLVNSEKNDLKVAIEQKKKDLLDINDQNTWQWNMANDQNTRQWNMTKFSSNKHVNQGQPQINMSKERIEAINDHDILKRNIANLSPNKHVNQGQPQINMSKERRKESSHNFLNQTLEMPQAPKGSPHVKTTVEVYDITSADSIAEIESRWHDRFKTNFSPFVEEDYNKVFYPDEKGSIRSHKRSVTPLQQLAYRIIRSLGNLMIEGIVTVLEIKQHTSDDNYYVIDRKDITYTLASIKKLINSLYENILLNTQNSNSLTQLLKTSLSEEELCQYPQFNTPKLASINEMFKHKTQLTALESGYKAQDIYGALQNSVSHTIISKEELIKQYKSRKEEISELNELDIEFLKNRKNDQPSELEKLAATVILTLARKQFNRHKPDSKKLQRLSDVYEKYDPEKYTYDESRLKFQNDHYNYYGEQEIFNAIQHLIRLLDNYMKMQNQNIEKVLITKLQKLLPNNWSKNLQDPKSWGTVETISGPVVKKIKQ